MIDQHAAEPLGVPAVCPKGIQLDVISRYHREVLAAATPDPGRPICLAYDL
jgi:hypothetical protein